MNPTDAQIDAIFGDSPFVARRKVDKSGYEVVQALNHDWREVISNEEPKHHGDFADYEQAKTARNRLHVRWVFGAA